MGDTTDHIHLHRIDPTVNMYRFYSLSIQPTLFGDVSVIRNWGRIGTKGQAMIHTCERLDEAHAILSRIAAMKRRKGYRSPTG